MSAALPPLDAGDGYANELAKWRARLAAWEETFAIWDLEEPHVPICIQSGASPPSSK